MAFYYTEGDESEWCPSQHFSDHFIKAFLEILWPFHSAIATINCSWPFSNMLLGIISVALAL